MRYRLIGEVGRGGLGRVFRARDLHLDRQVAVKELIDPGEPAQRRFVREALITARLQHPAIVPIYDAGQTADKGPFYTMKLVAGRSLADAVADTTSLEQRLGLLPSVIAVADAMAYAHSEKIIHRDLKPQNVLVGDFGETVLIDWGLAKDLDANEAESTGPYREASTSTETLDGAVMGTPAFMAPEQATVADSVDERADVYALGAMLYFVGSGTPPHAGKTIEELLVKVITGDVMPLREREPEIPVDLAAIVAKAMAHDPAKRYPSARELSDDLHKFQTGQLVGAKTYTLGERVLRWLRRNRAIVAVAGVAAAVLLGYGIWSVQRIRSERRRAEDEAERAVAAAKETAAQRDSAIAQALLVRARQYAATGHAAEELAVLRALARPEAGAESRRLAIAEGGLVWKSHQRLAMAIGREVGLAARSADGTRFVATEPGAIAVWDATTGRELGRQAIEAGIAAPRFGKIAAISPGARFAVLPVCEPASSDACGIMIVGDDAFALKPNTKLELRELVTGRVFASWTGSEQLHRRSLAFAADDSAIAIRRDDRLQLLDGTGTEIRVIDVKDCPGQLAIAPAGKHLAVACRDHVMLVGPDGVATSILKSTKPAVQLAFVSADRLLAIGDDVRLWDLARSELRGEAKLPEASEANAARDEGDDIEWEYRRPRSADVPAPKKRTVVPQIRIGSATSIMPRTSLLGPPPRLVAGGALVTLEGPDWQALALDGDRVRYALVDQLVPTQPPERCLSRIGGERHATVALDAGARMLVDEQELATGLAVAPAEGYRHTTTDEIPVRQLRPLLAAEADACLVWGGAVGAHTLDGGAVGPNARASSDGAGGVLLIDHQVTRIAASGARAMIAAADQPVESATGRHVAALDVDRAVVTIYATATGLATRDWKLEKLDPDATIAWVSSDVVEVRSAGEAVLVAVDPSVAPRPRGELVTDPRSRYGTRRDKGELFVVRVSDGVEVGRHIVAATATARPLPDDSGSIVVEEAGKRDVLTRAKLRTALAPTRQVRLGTLEIIDGYLVSRADDSVSVWELASGRAFAVPLAARDVAITGGEAWAVTGGSRPRLARMRLDGKGTRDLRLSTAGLPFHQVRDQLRVSADGKRLTAAYAVTEELRALATWDVETGALLWVGPPAARVIGDWVVSAGRAYVPSFDIEALLRDTGTRTNLRLCRDDLRAVPVVPPPAPDSYWAPATACSGKEPGRP
ncbi:MAG: serine/threonine-protein kinase [Kofleriaceae bacterium]